jgi:hypothetical protein
VVEYLLRKREALSSNPSTEEQEGLGPVSAGMLGFLPASGYLEPRSSAPGLDSNQACLYEHQTQEQNFSCFQVSNNYHRE